MDMSIGEMTSDITVETESSEDSTPAASQGSSAWAEQEKNRHMEHRAMELRMRTMAVGFHD